MAERKKMIYVYEITEYLQRYDNVEANSLEEALQKIEQERYKNPLDDRNFVGKDIKIRREDETEWQVM